MSASYPRKATLVYIGRRMCEGGGAGHAYREVKEDGAPLGESFLIRKPIKWVHGIGGLVIVELKEPNTVPLRGESAGFYRDKEARAEWEALDAACRGQLAFKSQAPKLAGWNEALEPIKRAMRKTNAEGRARIIAELIQELARP